MARLSFRYFNERRPRRLLVLVRVVLGLIYAGHCGLARLQDGNGGTVPRDQFSFRGENGSYESVDEARSYQQVNSEVVDDAKPRAEAQVANANVQQDGPGDLQWLLICGPEAGYLLTFHTAIPLWMDHLGVY